jgi:ubiquinone/menaquinone biosynthesis C-methylase UbiE
MTKNEIPSDEYTEDYYRTSCLGYDEFACSQGRNLLGRFIKPLKLAKLSGELRIVDVGCGRGEIAINSAKVGAAVWGMDYSWEAVKLAKSTITSAVESEIEKRICVHQADARYLPYANNFADRVFMLDVVEHLNPLELLKALKEVHRILKPNGFLIIHTVPNLWYYRYGYPIFRFVQKMRGIILPDDPRKRSPYSHLHINEQTPKMLKQTLDKANFNSRVWLESTIDYGYEENRFVRSVMKLLVTVYPFRWIFCDDIFAVANK